MSDQESLLTHDNLYALVQQEIPFGKYQGTLIADLPEEYLLWFQKKGFPKGQLGEWLQLALMLNIDGTKEILNPLRAPQKPQKVKPKANIRFD